MHKCFNKIVQTKAVGSPIVPAIIQFLLRLEEYTQEYGETLNEICLKLCEKIGSIDGVSDYFKVTFSSNFLCPDASNFCTNAE